MFQFAATDYKQNFFQNSFVDKNRFEHKGYRQKSFHE